jgi:hypothetical protein
MIEGGAGRRGAPGAASDAWRIDPQFAEPYQSFLWLNLLYNKYGEKKAKLGCNSKSTNYTFPARGKAEM